MSQVKQVQVTVIIAVLLLPLIGGLVPGAFAASRAFNIGFNQWVGFAPFFLAKEKGYYKDLEVNFQFIDLEGDKRAGLLSGRLQMICETMDMYQTSRDESEFPGKVIFAVDESLGGDGVLASDAVKTLKDTKGKKVVCEPGQPAYFVLQYLLNKEGMTLKDLDIQDMTSGDAAAAFMAGKADVAGTYEPYLSKALETRKGSHLLISTKDLPGLIVDVAIVTDTTLKKRGNDLKVIYEGWCKAINDLQTNPTESVAVMAKAFKMSPSEFNDTRSGLKYFGFEDNQKMFGLTPPIMETFDLAGQVLKKNGLTKTTAPGKDKISMEIVSIPKP